MLYKAKDNINKDSR